MNTPPTPTPTAGDAPGADALAADAASAGGLGVGLVVLMAGLLVLSAAASGSETALFGMTHAERSSLRRMGPASARTIDRLLGQPRRLLIAILLVNMLANVLYFAAAALLLQRAQGAVAATLAAVVPLVMIVLFGEILAKLLADSLRLRWSRTVAPVLLWFSATVGGLLLALDMLLVAPLARLLTPAEGRPGAPPGQVRDLLRSGSQRGALDDHELDLLEAIVELPTIRAREAMAPRIDLPGVEPGWSAERLAEAVRACGRPRLPVFERDPHVVSAILDAKRTIASGRPVLDAPLYVPENSRLDRVLARMAERDVRTAVCVDEHGESTGLLEASDVLRALVRLSAHGEDDIVMTGLGRWSVPARLSIASLGRYFPRELRGGVTLPPESATVAGAVLAQLGRMPEAGDAARLGGLTLEVESMRGRVIDRVLVRLDGKLDGKKVRP
ncbi:MAG: CNNM domain-containing protein [Planctomycetota bacterium]